MAKTPESGSAADAIADEAAKNTLALNPIVGLRGRDFVDAAQTVVKTAILQPEIAVKQWFSFMGDLGRIVAGESTRAVEPGDKRFNDPAWKSSRLQQKLLQSYLAWGEAIRAFVDKADLSDQDRARAKLIADILVDALAPTNGLVSNPTALKKLIDTGGESLWSGLKNYLEDLVKNGGLPSQVDSKPFQVGKNIATTPGAVVLRTEVFELIQYKPVAAEVWARPLLIVPPQINKFYSLDLSPDKSMIQFLLREGVQVFCISWRNPTAEQRDWGLDTYVEAVDEAVDAVRGIASSADVSLMGVCSGGITSIGLCGMAGRPRRVQGEEPHSRGLHARSVDGRRNRARHADHAADYRRGEEGLAASRRARRPRSRENIRLDETERSDLELLGQQLSLGQRAARIRHPLLEQRHDLAACAPPL